MGQIDVMAAQIGKGSEDAVIPILIILCKLVLLFYRLQTGGREGAACCKMSFCQESPKISITFFITNATFV